MAYSATLDFSNIFGPPRKCPGCGSGAIGTFDDQRDARFHCLDCGTRWRLAQGRTIVDALIGEGDAGLWASQ
ncbi:hypothetical protein [Nocardia sp. NPDC048505]|uniref:hypothetical protein n=1 Tax=unclassified Nocardia TaxID=2637762 RepID=UPI0033F54B3A